MEEKLIVSLILNESRLDLLQTIVTNIVNNILLQSYLPDIIHIFYSTESLSYIDTINKLKNKLENELENELETKTKIIFTNTENIGSYRILIPALKLYSNSNNIIITIDEELFNTNTEININYIKLYIEAYNKYKCIICSRGTSIDLLNINNINNSHSMFAYKKSTFIPIYHIIPEVSSGVLYHTTMFNTNFINLNFKEFPELILKNDELFLRLYTFKKNIKVFNIGNNKNNNNDDLKFKNMINNLNEVNTYYNTINDDIQNDDIHNDKINEEPLDIIQELQNIKDVENIITINNTNNTKNNKTLISFGTDIKQFQYDFFAFSKCSNVINFKSILEEKIFKKEIKSNFILINIEKDVKRYISATNEYKKLAITDFIHLKATYWKEKEKLITDLKFILEFMIQFNPLIKIDTVNNLTINEFSDINDTQILIQDGPLGCYCSHVRAMIYGYLHFEDYTIITEDDLMISNTENISKYIQLIPEDWDIICFNSYPINEKYDEIYYKFKSRFHSSHFYIIKNKSLPFLLSKMYPIFDQVDVLIASLYNDLNIYNITDTVYQKNYSTNTQNNLCSILTSPNYKYIRDYLDELNTILNDNINLLLPDNLVYNTIIRSNIIFDVLYNYIINNLNYESINYKNETINTLDTYNEFYSDDSNDSYKNTSLLKNKRLYDIIFIITNNAVKGINVSAKALSLLNDMNNIIESFTLHNTIYNSNNSNDSNDSNTTLKAYSYTSNTTLKAYSYGSTANTYMCNNIIIKAYNSKLRWTHIKHNNINDIFNKEIAILKKLSGIPNTPQLINDNDSNTNTDSTNTIANETKLIKLTYMGCSLYNNFILPEDWKEQINNNFIILTQNKIYYPEFNLKNIVYLNGKLSFIDYGLSELISDEKECNNTDNCTIFIELLTLLNEKFKSIDYNNTNDTHKKQVLYITFINNIKINNEEKYKNNIF